MILCNAFEDAFINTLKIIHITNLHRNNNYYNKNNKVVFVIENLTSYKKTKHKKCNSPS